MVDWKPFTPFTAQEWNAMNDHRRNAIWYLLIAESKRLSLSCHPYDGIIEMQHAVIVARAIESATLAGRQFIDQSV